MVELPENFRPDSALHPGKFLRQEIAARGMSGEALARLAQQPQVVIDAILAEQRDVTADAARAIGGALGVDAQFWLNLQAIHDQVIARMQNDKREPAATAGATVDGDHPARHERITPDQRGWRR